MKRTEPPKDPLPNKHWRYSPPKASADGKTVAVDLTQLTFITEHNRMADARFAKKGWK